MRDIKEKGRIYIILLFLLIAFHCVNNYIWLNKDNSPRGVDTIHHLNEQVRFYNKLASISSNVEVRTGENLPSFLSLFSTPCNWPRLMYFVASVANIFFGLSLFVTRMSNLIYFIILILAVYFIGKRLTDEKAGLLAAFIVSFYPGICGMSRQFEMDFPTTAMVALCVCLLLYTEGFKSKKYSLIFGISLGLGILTRGQTLFFVIAPLGYILYRTFLKNRQRDLIRVFNFILSISLAVLISSVWWRGHLREILTIFWDATVGAFIWIPCEFFTVNWFFYLFNTITHISPFFFLIFIVGFIIFVKSKIVKEKSVIILWIVIPYIIFTLILLKFGRYYFPSFPAIALISASGILSLKRRIIKIPLIILVLCVGMTQFFRLSYGLERLPYLSFRLPTIGVFWCASPTVNNHNQVIANFAKIMKERISKSQDIRVRVITERPSDMEYFLRLSIPNIQVFNVLHGCIPPPFDFLVVSSKPDFHIPNYELLRYKYEGWAIAERRGIKRRGLNGKELAEEEAMIKKKIVFIDEIIEEFKNYEILRKALLLPEGQYVFLVARPQ